MYLDGIMGFDKLKFASWTRIFTRIKAQILKHFTVFHFLLGKFIDSSFHLALTRFSLSVGGAFLQTDHFEENIDFPPFFRRINLISSLYNSIILWNSNIRLESPLILSQLRLHPSSYIYSLGLSQSSHFSHYSLNQGTNLNPIFFGKHVALKSLVTSSILVIYGSQQGKTNYSSLFSRSFAFLLLHQISKSQTKGNFGILHLIPSLTSFFPMLNNFFIFKSFKSLFFLDAESSIPNYKTPLIVIFQGTHGIRGVKRAEFILPSELLFERHKVSFLSITGDTIKTPFVLSSPFSARNPINTLFYFYFYLFPYSPLQSVFSIKKITSAFNGSMTYFPFFVKHTLFSDNFLNQEVHSTVWNSFKKNSLSRVSLYLSLAARRFSKENKNFFEK